MTDYRARALAAGLPAEQIERVTRPLETLEAVFRPLADSLRFDEEPVVTFEAAEDGE